ncbi:MAG: MBOAT family O-acyltransferase [Verrucomicrobiota bacterium]|jgi:D-alanyl-lipoteichoic acid acyltransferase DltB (MBOAT superfamily)|nr:MBOAT family O-acyltransferase [Verrucomicrobiota bacterium]
MLFNSWGYLLFLILLVPLHWALPHRWRLTLLAVGSLTFYCLWRWEFALLMVFSAGVDFIAARRMVATRESALRRRWLWCSLIINLFLLMFFKYTYFIYDNIQMASSMAGAELPDLGLRIILPLGISFYTFQTISYTIDIYRGVQKPTQRFSAFLVYVTFWPQLIAGPILRAGEVLPQLLRERMFNLEDFNKGLLLILAGLVKKVVLADSIAPLVDSAFASDANTLTAFDIWVAAFLFGFQIYFDFSGYSDIAIGSGRMMGIHFPSNFNWPYLAVTPRDFWKRWHISLSAWIRDYLYLPLTGQSFRTESRDGIAVAAENQSRKLFGALFLTWLIMGFWHGADWTFAVWGLYHAGVIALFRLAKPLNEFCTAHPCIAWPGMICLIMAGWIPFRAHDIGQMGELWITLLSPWEYTLQNRSLSGVHYLMASTLTIGMLATWACKRLSVEDHLPWPAMATIQILVVATTVFLVLTLLRPIRQFIYFQF